MKNYAHALFLVVLSLLLIALAIFITPLIKKAVPNLSAHKKGQAPAVSERPVNLIELRNSFKEAVLKQKQPTVVIFFAEWCPSCTIMHPVIDEVAREFQHIQFVSVDVDDFEDVANTYNIQAIPTFLFFTNGKPVDRSTGFMTKEQFVETLQEHFNKKK